MASRSSEVWSESETILVARSLPELIHIYSDKRAIALSFNALVGNLIHVAG